MIVYIYAIASRSVGYGSDAADAVILAGLVVVHLATGWFATRWSALFLPALAIVIAVPAGTPVRGEDPLPIWFGIATLIALPGAALIAAGVGARRLAAPLVGARRD